MAYDTSLKNGVSGGQTIYGGTGAGEDIIIDSTSNATKGDILLNPTGGNVGINAATPDRKLEIIDTANPQVRFTYTDGAIYTDFQTNSSGYMTITPSGGYLITTRFAFDTSTYFIKDAAAPGTRLYLDGAKYVKIVNLAGLATVFSANDNFIQTSSGNAVVESDGADVILSTNGNFKASLAPNRTVVLYAQNGHVYIPTDSSKLYWGAGNDQSVYYDGTSGYIKTNEVAASDLHLTTGTAKTLVLDTPVYEDLNFDPTSSGGNPATLPDYVTINNVTHREFTSANNQTCGDGEEMPHCYKLSGQLFPHIHIFLKGGESAGTTGVTFTFYWELRQSTGTTSNSTTLSATSAELGTTAGANKWTINDVTGFAGAAELGAQLTVRIARTGGDAGDVVVTTYGVHYPIDTVGSRDVTVK